MGSIFALEYPLTLQKNKTNVKNKKKSKKNKVKRFYNILVSKLNPYIEISRTEKYLYCY